MLVIEFLNQCLDNLKRLYVRLKRLNEIKHSMFYVLYPVFSLIGGSAMSLGRGFQPFCRFAVRGRSKRRRLVRLTKILLLRGFPRSQKGESQTKDRVSWLRLWCFRFPPCSGQTDPGPRLYLYFSHGEFNP